MISQYLFEFNDSTIEDSYRKQTVINGHSYMVEILDIGSIEGYTAIRDLWLRQGEGFVLVYFRHRRSFMRISKFHDQIKRVKNRSIPGLLERLLERSGTQPYQPATNNASGE